MHVLHMNSIKNVVSLWGKSRREDKSYQDLTSYSPPLNVTSLGILERVDHSIRGNINRSSY